MPAQSSSQFGALNSVQGGGRLTKALMQKGYDVNYSWGVNPHGQKFGGAVMPEMMRWLRRDGPVFTDPHDMVERAFRQPAAKKNQAPGP